MAKARKIDTATARDKLPLRRQPYWHKVLPGRFIGYRKMTEGKAGTWLARARIDGRDVFHPLDGVNEAQDPFKAADEKARAWFKQVGRFEDQAKVAPWKLTVGQVLARYVDKVTKESEAKGTYTRRRFEQLVAPYIPEGGELPFVQYPFASLRADDFADWREWMTALPTCAKRTKKDGSARKDAGKARAVSTVNRDLNTIRAAFNDAKRAFKFDDHWSEELSPNIAGEDPAARAYIPREDRDKLVAAAEEVAPYFVPFLRCHILTPFRPGAIAQLTVGNYSPRDHFVTVKKDKAGAGRKVITSPEVRELFDAARKDRIGNAPMFVTKEGKEWTADRWNKVFKRVVKAAGLDPTLSVYSLRHSAITDLVQARVDLAAVAKMAGTSLVMIEKHYYHLTNDTALAALAVLSKAA